MAYKALYRTYRPADFENMVGQKHIVTTLENAIESNKIAHAYLFSGPRGTGKTSTAKILAKAINCTGNGKKPCNECENCTAINENNHPDIIEIDAASNNGIDEIRELIDKVKYAPIKGKYKVYIIDEVHMMTTGAFNALLKTLEEPPSHVIFILATTDVHKVIPTVLSRCQRFDFNKISFIDIKNKIEDVLNKEGIAHEDKVSDLIAELADGGLRDALSILDQVISYATNNITLQHIYDIYGIMSTYDMCNYLQLVGEKKVKDVLKVIESYIQRGIDVKRLTYDLMVILKDMVVYTNTSEKKVLEKLNEEQAKTLSNIFSIDDALKIIDIYNQALANYKTSTNYSLFFELASLKIIELLSHEVREIREVKEVKKEKTVTPLSELIKETPQQTETIKEDKQPPVVESENVKPIEKMEVPKESMVVSYSMEEYINILTYGSKQFKTELMSRWTNTIKSYINNPNCQYVAQLIVDSIIGAAAETFALLVFEHKILANKANQKNNLLLIKKFINQVFNYDMNVYIVDRSTYIDITNKYLNLRTAHKLPPTKPLPSMPSDEVLEALQTVESEELNDETISIGKDIFGDLLDIKEE